MRESDFTPVLQDPKSMSFEQTNQIKSILDKYPYFQAARAIYLKGLKDHGSVDYNEALKTTAAYTTDRSILFDFITSEAFIQDEISEVIKKNSAYLRNIEVITEDVTIEKRVAIDEVLKQQINETDGVLDPTLFEPKEERPAKLSAFELDQYEKIEEAKQTSSVLKPSPEEILNLGKPLQFDKRESHSFNEWLKLTQLKPIKRQNRTSKEVESPEKVIGEKASTESSDKQRKFQLIDKFISENPRINPRKTNAPKGNLAKAQMMEPESLMTETLARIYVEQKNYKKAIQSYRILSLKYPEKSSFFANQIKAVEQLQEQNNKE